MNTTTKLKLHIQRVRRELRHMRIAAVIEKNLGAVIVLEVVIVLVLLLAGPR